MSHFRFCRLTENWVIIAENRLHKPDFIKNHPEDASEELESCPFEYGNEDFSPKEIFAIRDAGSKPNATGWKTRVVPNLYHALSIEEEKLNRRVGFFECQNGLGAHEVLIETPEHAKRLKDYTREDFLNYIKTAVSRINDLKKDQRLEYIQLFKNCGKYGGASVPHPHSQIIATPFIPKQVKERLEIKRDYYQKHGRSLLGDMAEEEIRLNERVVFENGTFVAFAPYASFFPFELMIVPKVPLARLSDMGSHQAADLADTMEVVFKELYGELGDFAYNMLLYDMPPESSQKDPAFFYHMQEYFRFFFRITPRIYHLAGFELSSGIHINPVPPELAAMRLRGGA